MSDKCIYCSRKTPKGVPVGQDQYVCDACALMSQKYLTRLLRLWSPSAAQFIQDEPKSSPTETREQKKEKKMKQLNILTLAGSLAVGMLAGATIRCDVDDGDDKDKAVEFIDVHGHDIQEAVETSMPGALVDFQKPDYECMAIGSLDRSGDTDFDVLFITACHKIR